MRSSAGDGGHGCVGTACVIDPMLHRMRTRKGFHRRAIGRVIVGHKRRAAGRRRSQKSWNSRGRTHTRTTSAGQPPSRFRRVPPEKTRRSRNDRIRQARKSAAHPESFGLDQQRDPAQPSRLARDGGRRTRQSIEPQAWHHVVAPRRGVTAFFRRCPRTAEAPATTNSPERNARDRPAHPVPASGHPCR